MQIVRRQLQAQLLRWSRQNKLIKCRYHWGNYDAQSPQCGKLLTDRTGVCGQLKGMRNRSEKRDEEAAKYRSHLLEIIRRHTTRPYCDYFRHDPCYYQPSNKRRNYQRTWSECPRIWLRPKPSCCYDREYACPIERRQRPAPPPEMTAVDRFLFNMEQICKCTTRLDAPKPPKKRCLPIRTPENCTKVKTPFPSFSESQRKCIPPVCASECACKVNSSLCEMWRTYHQNRGTVKPCTEAITGTCTHGKSARIVN